jgi:hypothetical protein
LDILSGKTHDKIVKSKVEGGTITSLDDFRQTQQTLGHPEMARVYTELYHQINERIQDQVAYASLLAHGFSKKPQPEISDKPQDPKPLNPEGF